MAHHPLFALSVAALAFRLPAEETTCGSTRARLLALVEATPGIALGAAATALGLALKTVTYHARILEHASGLVIVQDPSRRVYLWPPGRRPRDVVDAPELRLLLDIVRAEPGLSQARLAERLHVPRATVRLRLVRLETRGLVRSRTFGICRVYEPTQEGDHNALDP